MAVAFERDAGVFRDVVLPLSVVHDARHVDAERGDRRAAWRAFMSGRSALALRVPRGSLRMACCSLQAACWYVACCPDLAILYDGRKRYCEKMPCTKYLPRTGNPPGMAPVPHLR